MTPFLFNGRNVEIPGGWHEITVRQYIDLAEAQKKGDFIKVLSVLSSIPYSELYDAELSLNNMEQLETALLWTTDLSLLKELIELKAEQITIGDKTYPKIQDIQVKTYGQSICFQQLVFPLCNKSTNEKGEQVLTGLSPKGIPVALAIYFQPLITGKKFDPETLSETIALCEQTKLTEAYPIATFFLTKSLLSENVKQN